MYEDTAYEDEMPTEERLRAIAKLWDDMSEAKKNCVMQLIGTSAVKMSFLRRELDRVRERKK